MAFFCGRLTFRILLLLVSGIFFFFMPDILGGNPLALTLPYLSAVCFLVCVALFYRFPRDRSEKKIRNDIVIPPADPEKPVARDYHKDLEEKEHLLQFMFDVSTDGLWRFDAVTGKVKWSSRIPAICGIGKDLGDTFDVLKDAMLEGDRKDFERLLPDALSKNERYFQEVRVYDAEGRTRILLLCGKPQKNEDERTVGMVGTLADVTAQKQVERHLFYSAFHDSLTGLNNRQFFLDHIADDIARSAARPDFLFAVILLDVDHFTAVNDSFSHSVGDKFLCTFAERVSRNCRQGDIVARVSGDTLGIILQDIPGHTPEEDVQDLVRRLQAEVRRPFIIEGNEVLVTASMAVIFNKDFKDVETLLASADELLKQAKLAGNGSIQFFTSGMREKAMGLYKLEMEIRKAIQNKEFILMYQPITDILNGNTVVGFESLVRWNNTARGLVSPADFIPMAEETGLIVPMGEQILRMACKQVKKWVDMGYERVTVAVNFSARQFGMESMVDDVQKVLLETQLNPRNLKLEVTEYTAMAEVEKSVGVMRSLATMGIQISIDDFGTGYSSLVYLKRYPIHTLKIDRSFIKDIPRKPEDAAIVKMVIAMAKTLNLELIAEGVETPEQVDFLRAEGCRLIQGFYFSKPLLADAALKYMETNYYKTKNKQRTVAVPVV